MYRYLLLLFSKTSTVKVSNGLVDNDMVGPTWRSGVYTYVNKVPLHSFVSTSKVRTIRLIPMD